GVYTADPEKVADAAFLPYLTYQEVLERDLGVMDLTAICLCRDHDMPLRVFNMGKVGVLLKLMLGEEDGTLINGGEA
ncbi:MAG: UMP kinase, partial [Pseudomonadota bacterium]|nr:UMP kinase [Pseudomonadota bacterium]